MTMVNLHFPVMGESIPTDHGYALYGALARLVPALHDDDSPILIGPILGNYVGNGLLSLDAQRSRLRMRLQGEDIAKVLPLAGKALEIDGHRVRVGVPQVLAVVPTGSLLARLVTIKKSDRHDRANSRMCMGPAEFSAAGRRQLDALGLAGEAVLPLVRQGAHAGQPCRHVLRIKGKRLVGFSLQVTGLTAEESIKLQETGLGGRRKMGCGFFVPVREENQR